MSLVSVFTYRIFRSCLSSYRCLRLFTADFLLNPVLTHKTLILSECVLIMETGNNEDGKERRPVRNLHISMRNATEAQYIYVMLWGVIANWVLCSVFFFLLSLYFTITVQIFTEQKYIINIFLVLLVCLLLFHFNWVWSYFLLEIIRRAVFIILKLFQSKALSCWGWIWWTF